MGKNWDQLYFNVFMSTFIYFTDSLTNFAEFYQKMGHHVFLPNGHPPNGIIPNMALFRPMQRYIHIPWLIHILQP